jgi:hypothetical protein
MVLVHKTEREMGKTDTAYDAGRAAWRALFNSGDTLEFPENPFGDEWGNPVAKAFRKGFDAAARKSGYTYSNVDGLYCIGGEFETDEFEIVD